MSDPEAPLGGHPRGTLVLIVVYGLVFAGCWFAMYVGVYLQRGAVTP
jgi:hypothetical protein